MRKKIAMTPSHPEWTGFVDMHAKALVRFRESLMRSGMDMKHHSRDVTRVILSLFPDVDVNRTLEVFSQMGGKDDHTIQEQVCKRAHPIYSKAIRESLYASRAGGFPAYC